jgi:hypothetical protein
MIELSPQVRFAHDHLNIDELDVPIECDDHHMATKRKKKIVSITAQSNRQRQQFILTYRYGLS